MLYEIMIGRVKGRPNYDFNIFRRQVQFYFLCEHRRYVILSEDDNDVWFDNDLRIKPRERCDSVSVIM